MPLSSQIMIFLYKISLMPTSSSWLHLIRHASCVASTVTPKKASGEAGAFPDPLSQRVRLGRLTSAAITEQICDVDTLRSLGEHGPPEEPEESSIYVFGGTPTMSQQAAVTSALFRLRLVDGKVCKEVVEERQKPCWPAPRGHAKMCASRSEWLAVSTTQTIECCSSMEDMVTRPYDWCRGAAQLIKRPTALPVGHSWIW